jgi:putative tricarboxylic transport membrane protein
MSTQPGRKPGELVFALFCCVFGVVAFQQAYGISGFGGLTTPGVFPMLATGTMVVAGLFIVAGAARRGRERSGESTPIRFMREVLPLRHCIMIALMLAYLVLLPQLGFVVSSALFLFATFQYLWRRNPLLTLLLAGLSLGAIYVVFRIVFQVVLPQGTILGWTI